jgi:peroxiredoxin
MAETFSTFSLRPGDEAPDFNLQDSTGNSLSLREAVGPSGLLVIFACNHCPYVIHLAEAVGRFANEIAANGVNTVAISSNDIEKYPADAPDKMQEFAGAHGWKFPYLYDATQEIAKAYGAACTPDFFLFDSELRLYYAGQFDATRPGKGEPTGEDLGAAVKGMLAGEEPPVRPYPSSGCNIKWKPGNEPT